jgi:hypothetical protein
MQGTKGSMLGTLLCQQIKYQTMSGKSIETTDDSERLIRSVPLKHLEFPTLTACWKCRMIWSQSRIASMYFVVSANTAFRSSFYMAQKGNLRKRARQHYVGPELFVFPAYHSSKPQTP